MWIDLLANVAAVGLTVSVWAHVHEGIRHLPGPVRAMIGGLLMGLGAICTMLLAIQFHPGVYVDLRTTLVAMAGFFGGPLAAATAALAAALFRVYLSGPGVVAGVAAIMAGGIWGALAYYIRRRRGGTMRCVLPFTIGTMIASGMPFLLLPENSRDDAIRVILGPTLALTALSAILFSSGMMLQRRRSWLTHVLKSAIEQAPDYFYVKDTSGRILAANWNVARAGHSASPRDLVGLTDADLTDPEHAAVLWSGEQQVLQTGKPTVNVTERLPSAFGEPRTFVTSKFPIMNAHGTPIGLVGVTKDFTEHENLLANLEKARQRLDLVLNHTSDGIAYFDSNARLVLCNPRYRDLFPTTGYLRQPGKPLSSILRATYRTGEQTNLPPDEDAWIAQIVDGLSSGGEQEISLSNGTWMLIRTSPIAEGGAVVVVSDITHLKHAETELAAVAEQFRVLASVDPLTGLKNRRSLTHALDTEFARSRRNGSPISVVLLDIDWFKRFNDIYGHPAGDACLRFVADRLRNCVRRPADLVARYGGEEFVILLPETDAEGARCVIETAQGEIRALAMQHEGSPKGHVTISAGIATLCEDNPLETTMDLITQADRALYAAKDAGRDTALHWVDVENSRAPQESVARHA